MHIIIQKDDVDLFRDSKNPALSYEMIPNTYLDGELEINRVGFRDFERDEGGKKFRICVIGDSVTYGIGVKKNETYSYFLEKKLNDRGYDVEVWNMGVPAYNSIQKNILVKKAISNYDADLIVYQYFGDDSMPTAILFDPKKHNRDSEHVTLYEKDVFTSYFKNYFPFPEKINVFLLNNLHSYRFINLKIFNILNKIKYHNFDSNLITYKKNISEKYNKIALENSIEISSKKMIFFNAPVLIEIEKQQEEFPELKELSEKYNIYFLNLIKVMENKSIDLYSFRRESELSDDAHPNIIGHEFYANEIIKFIEDNNIIKKS